MNCSTNFVKPCCANVSVPNLASSAESCSVEYYGEERARERTRLYRSLANVPLKHVEFRSFEDQKGVVKDYHYYNVVTDVPQLDVLGVCLFHGRVQKYGPVGRCIRLPNSLFRDGLLSDYRSMWMVQLFYIGEEQLGPVYTFNKLARQMGNYVCIPLPNSLVHEIDRECWTVAFTEMRSVPSSLNGFVYPRYLVGDVLCVSDVMCGEL